MKVLTLTQNEFTQACAKLAQQVCADFCPDIVVGIRRGGAFVAAKMMQHFPGARYVEVSMSRASSSAKNSKGGSSMLRHLPYFVTNLMRIAESMMTSYRLRNGKVVGRSGDLSLPGDIGSVRKILVVDDAIDTGSTMLRVVESIKQQLPDCEVRTAALTLTQPHALVRPGYTLYNDRTLIRFPWSADFKA